MTVGKHAALRSGAIAALSIAIATSVLAAGASASISGKLHFKLQWGAGVLDGANEAEVCEVFASCRSGLKSAIPGGFQFPGSVAVNSTTGNVYVADRQHRRVQEFTGGGAFLLMFGWDVNKTKVEKGAPQAERNLCTATEVAGGAECAAGEEGTGLPGQMFGVQDITVDPSTGAVFVYEAPSKRVEEFTETGQFILMAGREVNETLTNEFNEPGNPHAITEEEKNLCTQAQTESGMECRIGKESLPESSEPLSFAAAPEYGNLLAFGGPKKLLYVGDEGRVQAISESGKWECQLTLNGATSPAFPSIGEVTDLAVDGAGNLYVSESDGKLAANDSAPPGVHEFNGCGGAHVGEFDKSSGMVEGIALDPFGRMAVIEGPQEKPHGALYELASDTVLSEFSPPEGMGADMKALAFDSAGELYGADPFHQDVESYKPLPIAELTTGSCVTRTGSSLTLAGTVNPNDVNGTEAFFQYGTSNAFGSITDPKQSFATSATVSPFEATASGLVPNQLYYYRTAAEDENDRAPELPIFGAASSCKTRAVPPAIAGAPEAFPSKSDFSVGVLAGAIDPENAPTTYEFQYAPVQACSELESEREEGSKPGPVPVDLTECPGAGHSAPLHSSEYRVLTVQQTVGELQPSTTYRYRLAGDNSLVYGGEPEGGETKGQEGAFTTIAAPSLTAATLPAGGVGATTATLAGTVDGDGFPATYSFELGIDEGANTRYGTVFSGPVGAGTLPEGKTLALSGLQPGTTYAYRVAISGGYAKAAGNTVYGAVQTFTTSGLPDVLAQEPVLAQLPVPAIAFPSESGKATPRAVKCRRGYKRNKQNRCVKSKKRKARKARRAGGVRNFKGRKH